VSSIPDYHSIQYNGSISGSFNKKASYFSQRGGRQTFRTRTYYTASTAVLNTTTALLYSHGFQRQHHPRHGLRLQSIDAHRGFAAHRSATGSERTLNCVTNTSAAARAEASAGLHHFLRWHSVPSSEHAHPTHGFSIINDHIVNETHFQYRRSLSSTTPVSSTPTVSCIGNFSGALRRAIQYRPYRSSGIAEHDHHVSRRPCHQVWGMAARQFGRQLANANFNGSFSSLAASLCLTLNGLAQGQTFAQIAASCPASQTGGCLPNNLTYTTEASVQGQRLRRGAPTFRTTEGEPLFHALRWLRWETQTIRRTTATLLPRVAICYALDGHRTRSRPRGSARRLRLLFMTVPDRQPDVARTLQLQRNSQTQISIANPKCYNATSLRNISGGLASCGSGTAATPEIYQIAPNFHALTRSSLEPAWSAS